MAVVNVLIVGAKANDRDANAANFRNSKEKMSANDDDTKGDWPSRGGGLAMQIIAGKSDKEKVKVRTFGCEN